MKRTQKILVGVLVLLLAFTGCSQDLLNQLLQKEEDGGTEVPYEMAGQLLARVCFEGVDTVMEYVGEQYYYSQQSINGDISIGGYANTEKTVTYHIEGSYNVTAPPTSGTVTLDSTISNFRLEIIDDTPMMDEDNNRAATLEGGGSITSSFSVNATMDNDGRVSQVTISNFRMNDSLAINMRDSSYKDGELKLENFTVSSVTFSLDLNGYITQTQWDSFTGKVTYGGTDITNDAIVELKIALPMVIEEEIEHDGQ